MRKSWEPRVGESMSGRVLRVLGLSHGLERVTSLVDYLIQWDFSVTELHD